MVKAGYGVASDLSENRHDWLMDNDDLQCLVHVCVFMCMAEHGNILSMETGVHS